MEMETFQFPEKHKIPKCYHYLDQKSKEQSNLLLSLVIHTLIGIHLLMVTNACSTLPSENFLLLSMVLMWGRPGGRIWKDRNLFLLPRAQVMTSWHWGGVEYFANWTQWNIIWRSLELYQRPGFNILDLLAWTMTI